jgi:hypothetical protein
MFRMNRRHSYSKPILKSAGLKLLFLFILFAFCFYGITPLSQQVHPKIEKEQVFRYPHSKPRVEINDLKYDFSFMGESNFQLKADTFLIRKKKFGLIRFGLAQEALFKNAEISFFYNNNGTTPSTAEKSYPSESLQDSSLISSLEKTFTSTHAKRLYSLVMEPVAVTFYDTARKGSQLYASSASFQLKNKKIVFLGKVKLEAGEKLIRANKLIFFPETKEISFPNNFSLAMQGVVKTKKPATTDIFLTSISL